MRAAITYRSERRNAWREYRSLYRDIPGTFGAWEEYNNKGRDPRLYSRWHIGSFVASAATHPSFGRSKYMPHNGKREMERRRRQLAA